MNIADELSGLVRQLESAAAVRETVRQALTLEQQNAISLKIANDPRAFHIWASSDAGRAAIRQLAGEFLR